MSGKSSRTPLLTLVILAVVAGLFYALQTLREATPEGTEGSVDIAAAERDDTDGGFDFAAYEKEVAARKAEGRFDHAAHEESLLQVGVVEADEALRAARNELVKYEAANMRATPEREAWTAEIEGLYSEANELGARQIKLMQEDAEWQRLSEVLATNHLIAAALRQEVYKHLGLVREALQDPDAPPPGQPSPEQAEAVKRLQAAGEVAAAAKREFEEYQLKLRSTGAIGEIENSRSELLTRANQRQVELKATFADDPVWKELQQKIEQAEAQRRKARARVARLIRIRMQTESELKHTEIEEAAGQQENEP